MNSTEMFCGRLSISCSTIPEIVLAVLLVLDTVVLKFIFFARFGKNDLLLRFFGLLLLDIEVSCLTFKDLKLFRDFPLPELLSKGELTSSVISFSKDLSAKYPKNIFL